MWTLIFWKSITERALKTFVEALAAALVVSGTTLGGVDWLGSLSIAGLATLIAVLLNVGVSLGTDGGPSVGNVEKLSPKG